MVNECSLWKLGAWADRNCIYPFPDQARTPKLVPNPEATLEPSWLCQHVKVSVDLSFKFFCSLIGQNEYQYSVLSWCNANLFYHFLRGRRLSMHSEECPPWHTPLLRISILFEQQQQCSKYYQPKLEVIHQSWKQITNWVKLLRQSDVFKMNWNSQYIPVLCSYDRATSLRVVANADLSTALWCFIIR